jgi:hypothetical protein
VANNQYTNKVVFNGTTLIDVSGTTVAADKLLQGYTAMGPNGQIINGTLQQQSYDFTGVDVTADKLMKGTKAVNANGQVITGTFDVDEILSRLDNIQRHVNTYDTYIELEPGVKLLKSTVYGGSNSAYTIPYAVAAAWVMPILIEDPDVYYITASKVSGSSYLKVRFNLLNHTNLYEFVEHTSDGAYGTDVYNKKVEIPTSINETEYMYLMGYSVNNGGVSSYIDKIDCFDVANVTAKSNVSLSTSYLCNIKYMEYLAQNKNKTFSDYYNERKQEGILNGSYGGYTTAQNWTVSIGYEDSIVNGNYSADKKLKDTPYIIVNTNSNGSCYWFNNYDICLLFKRKSAS